ncbi:MAG: hypothetical protein HY862_06815 [Chloroflexi bacterium]|nr:hypothetical protein [Chloroflexota bacterium]
MPTVSPAYPKVKVSAPGKLFLLGEHAIVYDGVCLITAVDSRLYMTLKAESAAHPTLTITAPAVGLENWRRPLAEITASTNFSGPASFITSCVALFHRHFPFDASLVIETASDFGATLGLGSSSATVATALFGLSALFGVNLSPRQLFDMGVEAIQQVQHLGSGADLAAAIFGGTLYYANHDPREITPLNIPALPLMVVYSGQKAGTVNYVRQVRELHDALPKIVPPIIELMLTIVEEGRPYLEKADWPHFGQLMNIQHGLLHAIGVDTTALADIVFRAREAGAYGAKLSGAGGGDCAIILISAAQHVTLADTLSTAGYQALPLSVNAPGVRLE